MSTLLNKITYLHQSALLKHTLSQSTSDSYYCIGRADVFANVVSFLKYLSTKNTEPDSRFIVSCETKLEEIQKKYIECKSIRKQFFKGKLEAYLEVLSLIK